MTDPTNPKYYSEFPIQPYEFLWANREYIGYTEGNIIKYVCRYSGKNGLEDLKKAQWYLNELVRRQEAAQSRTEDFEPELPANPPHLTVYKTKSGRTFQWWEDAGQWFEVELLRGKWEFKHSRNTTKA